MNPGIHHPPLAVIKAMSQSKSILRKRLGVIHACPVQSQCQITSIWLCSDFQKMMRIKKGKKAEVEIGQLQQRRRNIIWKAANDGR